MDRSLVLFIVIVIAFSIVVSAVLLAFVFKRKRDREIQQEFETQHSIKRDKRGSQIGIWVFLILFGLLFDCISGGIILFEQNKTKSWDEIFAVVSYYHQSPSGKINVEVSYEYQGYLYEDIRLNYKSRSMREGKQVTILVNPEEPQEITIDPGTTFPLFAIFLVVGSMIFLFALYNLIKDLRRRL